MINSAKVSCYF